MLRSGVAIPVDGLTSRFYLEAMGWHWGCLLAHAWQGCHCERCGKVRDREHDWQVVDCRKHCARCGQVGGLAHAWTGCSCKNCGAENHQWVNSVCQVCGERCQHADVRVGWESQFFHKAHRPDQLCQRCGARVE